MLDLGWSELLVVGVVALIIVGPKDLPVMFRNVGRFVGKARGMAREFSRAMEAAADEAGVKDIDKTLKAAVNPKSMGIDALRDAAGLGAGPAKVVKPAATAAAPAAAAATTAAAGEASAPAAAPAAASAAVKPGGETEALIKKRSADKAEAQRKATERAAARALGETPAAAAPVAGQETGGTA
jgi:sec-independent protein translocase protein TatB